MPDLPTGTVTFLFSDIEGSTRLLQHLGDTYPAILVQHQRIMRAVWAAHGGVEIATEGDSFFVVFRSAEEAVAAAAEATRGLAEWAWPDGVTVRVRIGLHTGLGQLGADSYVGLDVHRAARIAAVAHGGQVVISAATQTLVEQHLPADVRLRDLGDHRLKDLLHPEHIYQLVFPDLPNDFPPLKSLESHPNNLPVQPTELLGRGEAIAALTALLRQDGARLITLTGPGGMGKTRLSLQVAAELMEAFTDGVWFVSLARLTDPALVISTIAQTLGLRESGSQLIADVLRDYLERKQLLLVLDNFEQIVAAAPEISRLLERSAGLKALVTSRTPLRLRGEREFPLSPLTLPDPRHLPPPERLVAYPAIALFVERAQAVRPSFIVTIANAPTIADICARLDGLPLAIELAAARIKLLTPDALLTQLTRKLTTLGGGARDLDERQRTLRNTIAWSHDLLAPAERVLFRRLAVFVGGWTLEAAEMVCVAPEGAEPLEIDLLDGLQALVDQSLISQTTNADESEPRFGMLQVIREYARERLEDAPGDEFTALRRAHLACYEERAEEGYRSYRSPREGSVFAQLDREHDNLRAALGWVRTGTATSPAAPTQGVQLAGALAPFWYRRGYLSEGRGWLEGFLAAVPHADDAATPDGAPPLALARALRGAGLLALWQGDESAATTHLEHALALARRIGARDLAAEALNSLGVIGIHQDNLELAEQRLTESATLLREMGDHARLVATLNNLGSLMLQRGDGAHAVEEAEQAAQDLRQASEYFEEALALARQAGNHDIIGVATLNLGYVALAQGDLVRAEALGHEALTQPTRNSRAIAERLELLAKLAAAMDRYDRAARLLGAAAAIRESIGAPLPKNEQTEIGEWVAAIRAAVGDVTWAATFAAGQALSEEGAIAEVLGEPGTGASASAQGSKSTGETQ